MSPIFSTNNVVRDVAFFAGACLGHRDCRLSRHCAFDPNAFTKRYIPGPQIFLLIIQRRHIRCLAAE